MNAAPRFRGITKDGDWMFGRGRQSYLEKNRAIAADIRTSLLFVLNDFFAAMDLGIDWKNIIGGKNPTAQQNLLLQSRQAILRCDGVQRILSVHVHMSDRRRITITYRIATVYSLLEGQVQNT